MSWWGKVLGGGFGFLLGGPLGAAFGMAAGHQFDRGLNIDSLAPGNTERVQMAFFTATFSVMGYLAKADGTVSRSEIQMAENIMDQMNLDANQRKMAIELFNHGKKSDFPLDDILQQFKTECHRRTNLLQMFLEILIATAYADGNLDHKEHVAIVDIAQKTGFSTVEIERLINMMGAQHQTSSSPQATLEQAYAVLGIEKDSTDASLKKTYRRLMSQHHPDKLVAKGLPEEMIKLANTKTAEIKKAYEQIKASRK